MSNLLNHGIIEVAALTPRSIRQGDPRYNVDRMLEIIREVNEKNRTGERQTRIVVYPEMCVTGYNCGDLFNQSALIHNAAQELKRFAEESNDEFNPIMFVGMAIRKDNQLFNCAVAVHRGKILGVVPKTFLPNYSILYEARCFRPSFNRLSDKIMLYGESVPFTPNLLFEDEQTGTIIGAELCEDLWMPLPPSAYHCLHGANIIANLSSSNQTFGKTDYREDLVRMHSSVCVCGYIYTCATSDETTMDSVFAGHNIIAGNGEILAETKFMDNKDITYGEIDIERGINERTLSGSYMAVPDRQEYSHVYFKTFPPKSQEFSSGRQLSSLPFVPQNIASCSGDILNLQITGLAQALKKNHYDKIVIDMSGGLNSVLALIVAVEAFKVLGQDVKGIIGVTTLDWEAGADLQRLMTILGITGVETAEKKACTRLEDAAAQYGAVILGISDLTELALGRDTHGGDRISVYGVNASVPKTVIRSVVDFYAMQQAGEMGAIMTAVSARYFDFASLLSRTRTVDAIQDSYIVYDFVLYYMLKCGFGPQKIYDLFIHSRRAGKDEGFSGGLDKEKILTDMKTFYEGFFTRQLWRACMPEGIKVYPASLSRADWRMTSYVSPEMWLRELEEMVE